MPRKTVKKNNRKATRLENNSEETSPEQSTAKLSIKIYPDTTISGGKPKYNGNKELLTSHDSFGDFRVSKDFIVKGENPQDFVVIQKIKKKTVVNLESGTLNTTEQILEFTDGEVNSACDSYYEYFDIDSKGKSVDYDKFTNGAIAKYNEEKEVLDENDEGYVYNTGEIIQEGTSVCLKKGCGECDKILGLGWYHGINTPANGLPYLAYNKKNEKIVSHAFSGTHSNVINHTVVVTWDESEMEEGCPISHVDNYINGVKQE
jgi:hypothetical protein